MRFSDDGSTWSAWEPYATSKPWTLPAGDGSKTVYVQYRDNVGNISSSYNDSIILDTVAPTGSILIDGGATYATSTSVTLNLSASDAGSGVDEMRFSDDGSTWSAWEPYATSKPWTLPAGDGSKTVYVQYRDLLGNISVSYSNSILLDTTPPDVDITSPTTSNTLYFTVSWSGTDATSGIADFDIQYKVGASGTYVTWLSATSLASEQFGPSLPVLVVPGELYTFRLRARDNAGNESGYALSPETETQVLDVIVNEVFIPLVTR
jgi:diphthamide biosynthesis methyltransferase